MVFDLLGGTTGWMLYRAGVGRGRLQGTGGAARRVRGEVSKRWSGAASRVRVHLGRGWG